MNMNNFAVAVSSLGVAIGVCILGYHIWSMDKEMPENMYVKNLLLVQAVFRHGARNPTYFYNSDPHKYYNWPGGKGYLTNTGKTQMYNLGKKFRKKYSGFLSDLYSLDDIDIFSSDVPRTLSSAYVFLAGLYPPKKSQIWNNNLMWQPVPVHSIPRNLDNLLALKSPCAIVNTTYNALMNSDDVNMKYKDLYSNLSHYANQTISTVLDLEMIYSTWKIEEEYDLSLPDWVHKYFPEPLKQATCESFHVYSSTKLLRRLRGGVILSKMIDNMKMKSTNTSNPDRKMILFSGHDLTLTALFKTLGFEECILPEFGATLVIELHSNPETLDPEVKLVYHNTSISEPLPLRIPNCDEPCKLDKFIEITKELIPANWEEECSAASL